MASRAIADTVDPTCVLVGEASSLLLERGQRGRAEIRLDTFGKMAHSSHPEFGINAADTMNALLAFLKQQFIPPRDPFLGEGILVLTSLYTSPAGTGGAVPEKCTALFDRSASTFRHASRGAKVAATATPKQERSPYVLRGSAVIHGRWNLRLVDRNRPL